MTISQKDLRILYQQSGNRCAFPGCTKLLVYREDPASAPTPISEVAHIVAKSLDGPRGSYPLPTEARDLYDNLILLCEEHHHIVDDNPASYPVEMLCRWKTEHEKLVTDATNKAVETRSAIRSPQEHATETLYSTLLPVLRMPRYIYGTPCKYKDAQEKKAADEIVYPINSDQMLPFIIRGGMLFCFQDLFKKGGPFRDLVGKQRVKKYKTSDWWNDPDKEKWFISLLNRSLNKLTGRKGLNLDKRRHRYYFTPSEPGKSLEISYRPLNQSTTSRQVVWQPITKKTGDPKAYWYHRAVALHFHKVSNEQWCLSIRPEMYVTQDGKTPLVSDKIGSKVTRKKARMFNYDLLGEVQFWRDFLSDSQPRIVFPFDDGGQYVAISTTMMQTEIEWPGIPREHQKPFKNIEYIDDLFSWAEWKQLQEEYEDDEWVEEEDSWDE